MFYGHAFDEIARRPHPDHRDCDGISRRTHGLACQESGRPARRDLGSDGRLRDPLTDPVTDGSEIAAVKKKNMEEELQRPAFLRMRPNRLRS